MPKNTDAQLVEAAFILANRATVESIETEAIRVRDNGATWWDVRCMLDPQIHPQEVIGMNADTINFALASGLATSHPDQALLLRIEGHTP
jgi:hypothetical protein